MPRRELRSPKQIEAWLEEWGQLMDASGQRGTMVLIGSGGILWHAFQQGVDAGFDEASMDVDPVTNNESVATLCYDAMIGSEFEMKHGWHVNVMPSSVMKELPDDWKFRAESKTYGGLTVVVPSVEDLLVPKRKRGEPRDQRHEQYVVEHGLGTGEKI